MDFFNHFSLLDPGGYHGGFRIETAVNLRNCFGSETVTYL
jgi:hypothetical protein